MFDRRFLQSIQALAIALPDAVLTAVIPFLPKTLTLTAEQWHYQLVQIVPFPASPSY